MFSLCRTRDDRVVVYRGSRKKKICIIVLHYSSSSEPTFFLDNSKILCYNQLTMSKREALSTKTIKTAVFWVILLAAPIIAFIPYIPIGNLGFSADDILFLLIIAAGLIGLFLIKINGGKEVILSPALNNVTFAFIALITVSVFSCLYNAENLEHFISMAVRGPVRFLLTLFFLIIIYFFLDSKKKIKWLLLAILGASAAESAFGIAAFLFSWQGPFNIGIASSRGYSVLSGIIGGRVNGTFGSVLENFTGSNLLASYLAILIPVSISFIIIIKEKSYKILMGAVLFLQLFCLFLTYTRTSILISLASVLFFAWIIGKKKMILWVLISSLALALVIPGIAARFIYDSTERLDIWKSAALVIRDYPVWGVGPGNYLDVLSGNVIRYEVFTFDTEVLTPHNFFLYAWAVLGIFGFLAIIGIVYIIAKDLRIRFKNSADYNSKILLAGILASSLAFLAQNFTNNFLFVPVVASYFWVMYIAGLRTKSVYI